MGQALTPVPAPTDPKYRSERKSRPRVRAASARRIIAGFASSAIHTRIFAAHLSRSGRGTPRISAFAVSYAHSFTSVAA